jgi:hypothetical protein
MYVLVALAAAAQLLPACGGGGSTSVDTDAGAQGAACNPVDQTGCQAGQKCGNVVADPNLVNTHVACVPNGTVAAGGNCTRGAVGPDTGYDNCVGGYECLDGVCTQICTGSGATKTCTDKTGTNCVTFNGVFQEVAGAGLCVKACDPVAQNCPKAGDGCYLGSETFESSCAAVPEQAKGIKQDQQCFGATATSCFLNGCAPGFDPLVPKDPVNPTVNVCVAFCATDGIGTHTGRTINPAGDPTGMNCTVRAGANHQCRFVQSFFRNASNVPAKVGLCVDVTLWGDCTKCNITNTTTFHDTCVVNHAFGCVDYATLMAIPMGPAANAPTHAQLLEQMFRRVDVGIGLVRPGWDQGGQLF